MLFPSKPDGDGSAKTKMYSCLSVYTMRAQGDNQPQIEGSRLAVCVSGVGDGQGRQDISEYCVLPFTSRYW